jgi:hypothetical protein
MDQLKAKQAKKQNQRHSRFEALTSFSFAIFLAIFLKQVGWILLLLLLLLRLLLLLLLLSPLDRLPPVTRVLA